jgi:hypothetical protein
VELGPRVAALWPGDVGRYSVAPPSWAQKEMVISHYLPIPLWRIAEFLFGIQNDRGPTMWSWLKKWKAEIILATTFFAGIALNVLAL